MSIISSSSRRLGELIDSAEQGPSSDAVLKSGEAYTPSPLRWLVLLLHFQATVINQAAWITFAPLRDETADAFGVDVTLVDALSVVFMAAQILLTLPTSALLTAWGLRAGVLAGAALTAAGCAIRACSLGLGAPSYALLFLGTCVAACGQPLLLNAPPVLAAAWFPPAQRAGADTVGTVATSVGAAVGMLVAPAMPTLVVLLRAEAIAALLALTLVFFFLRRAPPTPPSLAAATARPALRESARVVFASRGWWSLLVAFSFPLGAFNALATLIDAIVSPFGYSPEEASNLGALVVGCGLVGSALVAVAADRFSAHRRLLVGCFAFAVPASACLPFALKSSVSATSACLALIGGSMMPVLPLVYEMAAESTFPAPEALTAGLLMAGGQVVGLFTTLGGSWMLRKGAHSAVLGGNAVCVMAGLVAALSFDGDLRRLAAEGEKRGLGTRESSHGVSSRSVAGADNAHSDSALD